MPVTLRSLGSPPSVRGRVALVVAPSGVGAHVAIAYQADTAGSHRVVHQAWHYDSRDEALDVFISTVPEPVGQVEAGLEAWECDEVRMRARLVGRRLGERGLPYALHPRDATVREDGSFDLRDGLGLTCATFVLKVFEAARVALLNAESWDVRTPARVAEDIAMQSKLVEDLRKRSPEHADRVAADIGCTRIRAEEVAAASGIEARPASYGAVEPEGRAVIAWLDAP